MLKRKTILLFMSIIFITLLTSNVVFSDGMTRDGNPPDTPYEDSILGSGNGGSGGNGNGGSGGAGGNGGSGGSSGGGGSGGGSIKNTKVPFEDTTYTVNEKEDKPHNLTSEKESTKTVRQFTERDNPLDVKGIETIQNHVLTFIQMMISVIIAFAVIMITFAGFKIATSEGNSEVVRRAKMQIMAAGFGIGLSMFTMVIIKGFMEIINIYNSQ